jgi:NAD(P)H-hydrate epimerase
MSAAKSLSVAQIREADRRCIEGLGIPGAVLMNAAGAAVFHEIRKGSGPIGVVCGKGNNGGDGFVVARLALVAGIETKVVLLAYPYELQGDAAVFMNAYRRLGGRIEVPSGREEIGPAMGGLSECETLVDAMLGTGTRGEVNGAPAEAMAHWPEGIPTIAVDVPSGLDADTGEICGQCVMADVTVTFQYLKRGFANPSAKPYLGRVVVADIGIPPVCADDAAWQRLMAR